MTRYSKTAMSLHWLIAALLIYNYALGERTEHLRPGAELFAILQLHKSVGISVLLLSLWRLAIRIWRPQPVAVVDAAPAKLLSTTVHALFYVVMIGAPLTGWMLVSTAEIRIPTMLFGWIPWPNLPWGDAGRATHETIVAAHELLSKLMLALIALHVIGAIRHQFVMKDDLLGRMMPTSRSGWGALAVALALLGGSFALGRVGPIPGINKGPTPIIAGNIPPVGSKAGRSAALPENAAAEADAVEAKTDAEATVVTGPVPKWRQSPGGQLGFTITANGEQVNGRFGSWSSVIVFDSERLGQSSIRASINLASVTSGDSERDAMLAGSDFFATPVYPQATFASADIRSLGSNRYEARGSLTLKGISRPVRLAFTLDIENDKAAVNGTATLSRAAFGVGSGQFEGGDMIGTDVAVTFSFRATRQ